MNTEYAGTLRLVSEKSEFALSVKAIRTAHNNERILISITVDNPKLIPQGQYVISFSGEMAERIPLSPSLVTIHKRFRLVGLRHWQATSDHWDPVYRDFGER